MWSGQDPISLDELRRLGRDTDVAELERIAAELTPEDIATIVYTSGTTGPPKGCVTAHRNLMQTARMYEQQIEPGPGSVVFMFLPLAHSLARVTQMVVLDVGGTVAYWRGDSKSLLDDLASTRPTHASRFAHLREDPNQSARQGGGCGSAAAGNVHRSLGTGRRVRALEHQGRPVGPLMRRQYAVADRLVLSKVRAVFGPDLELAFDRRGADREGRAGVL